MSMYHWYIVSFASFVGNNIAIKSVDVQRDKPCMSMGAIKRAAKVAGLENREHSILACSYLGYMSKDEYQA